MSFRYPKGGFITAFYDPLQVPNAPTIGTATAGDTQLSVTFTAPANVGGSAITGYGAVAVDSSGNSISGTGSSSPITVTGLSNGTAYTAKVWAINSYGPSPYSAASGSVTPAFQRAVFGGGYDTNGVTNVISYINMASTSGNSIDFGDLTVARNGLSATSSSSRGVFGAGLNSGNTKQNVLDYITLASIGNAIDFGDLTVAVSYNAGCGSSTRGLYGGGQNTSNIPVTTIGYITIATTGDATSFGALTLDRYQLGACSSSTRGVWAGGYNNDGGGARHNVIDYVTIASTGNATDFGDLPTTTNALGGCSSATRGLFAGGSTDSGDTNVINYITIASAGNASDFGDLINQPYNFAATSSSTKGFFAGGYFGGETNVIQYVTIASTGNAIDFGDLTAATNGIAGCSSDHGGLQ
jgi:hypothetical protein